MKMWHSLVVAVSLAGFSHLASACQFDGDCRFGGHCEKPAGSLYGWCVGGLENPPRYELQAPRNPLDINKDQGIPCEQDQDCGEGGRCIKRTGVDGVCL